MTTQILDPNMPAVPSANAAPTLVHTAPSQVPPEPVIPLAPPPPAGGYTLLDIERAREQEKAKLYDRLNASEAKVKQLAEENAKLKTTTSGTANPEQPTGELAEVKAMLAQANAAQVQMQQQVQTLANAHAQAEAQRYAAELQVYTQDRVAQYESQGYGLIREMIGGSNAQEIEASIQRAHQAFKQYVQPQAPRPISAPVAIIQQPMQLAPNGFPTTPNPAAVPTQDVGQQGFVEDVRRFTSPDAIRSGEYAKNRAQIMGQLQQQGGGVSGALSNQPRFMPTPGQQPQSTWSGVTQPQAKMAPLHNQPRAPIPPQQMQPQAQQWPQQQPQQWGPQQPQQYQQPQYAPQYQQPQQMMQPGQPFQPAQLDQGAPLDIAAARAMAQQTAQRHLQNPGAVPNTAMSNAPSPVKGYEATPNHSAVFVDGVNPMQRNN